MEPPEREEPPQQPPVTRGNRILGLIAAVGFSIAMWAFIGMAILGLVLKVLGARH